MVKKRTFACGTSPGYPQREDGPILTPQVANQNAGFASSCPLADSAMYLIKTPMKLSFHGVWVISFSVFYRNLLFHLVVYYYFILFYLLFYSVVAERNCLLLNSRLDKVYIVLQAWLFRFVRAVPWFELFFHFGLSGLWSFHSSFTMDNCHLGWLQSWA